tara:strand:- start:553 stop:768 length:216 start_codon:yes stop_codon:yes gene_type:complete
MVDPLDIRLGSRLRILKRDLNAAGVDEGNIIEVKRLEIGHEGITISTGIWTFSEHINDDNYKPDFNFMEFV